MNLIALQIPIHKVENNLIQGTHKILNYTITLDHARLSDFNHSIYLPEKTVITQSVHELLKMDVDADEIKILFTQQKLMKQYDQMKFNKKVTTGLLTGRNQLVEEVLDKTPIFFEKDSIKQSLWLLEFNKIVNAYVSIIPERLVDRYIQLRKSIERVKPISAGFNLANIENGFAFTGIRVREAKNGFRIKNFPDKSNYYFTSTGKPFYSLGNLARLCLEVQDAWNR